MKKLTELKERQKSLVLEIEAKELEISEKQSELDNFDISEHADNNEYDNWLDEVSGMVVIGSLKYSASHVLSEVDPIAYRCGFSDYCDSLEPSDFQEYTELEEQLSELESDLIDLQEELKELENDNE
jgi:peptidoglycan hydrolase CwlO-like protein